MTSGPTRPRQSARVLLELCSARIAFFNTLAASAGFLIAADEVDGRLGVLALGVFALACGARSLNQYQERETDALMPRTSGRPLCTGRLRPADALAFSAACLLFGLFVLLMTGAALPAVMGGLAVVWYNGLYTTLKRYWAFAVVPGALVGMLPPAMGWVAAGGSLTDGRLGALCFFCFMWQVPHSWVFILRFGEEYELAGLPSLTRMLNRPQLSRIVFTWLSAAAVSSLFMIDRGLVEHRVLHAALVAGAAWIIVSGGRLLGRHDPGVYSTTFRRINLYAVLVLAVLLLDRVRLL